ncbi:FAD-dependent oxidoreductase, partial [Streptococcus pyogenes]
ELISADRILIASGARPDIPNIPGKEYGVVSDDIFEWDELPNSLAVIGAGYISVEIAGLMHHLGVKTDLFVRKEAPLRSFDPY